MTMERLVAYVIVLQLLLHQATAPTTTTTTTLAPDPPGTTTTTTTTTTAPDPPGTTTTTTTAAPDPPGTTTTTTTAAPAPPGTTTLASTTLATDPCSGSGLSISASGSGTIESVNYPSNYDPSVTCQWTITSTLPGYTVQISIGAFVLETDTYCTYDKLSFYDGTTTSATLLNELCGTLAATSTISSTGTSMLIVFVSDATYTFSGFRLTYNVVDGSYPGCKAAYSPLTASVTSAVISSTNYPSDYPSNTDQFWLITNPGGDLIMQLVASDIERSTSCVYDRLVIYDGGCTSNNVLLTHCGTYLRRLELTGSEYLVQFHSDNSVQKGGFSMNYFLGTANTGAPTTTTTTQGPPVDEEVDLMNQVLTNYDAASLPSRDLTTPIATTVDVSLVGINDLDEVAQMLTTTALFEVKWKDDSLQWPSSKAANIVKLLVPQNDIWKPDIVLINGFEAITQMGAKFMFIVVDNGGNCVWRPFQIMKSACSVDMSLYPYDEQKCDLKIGAWASSSSQVNTQIGQNGLQRHEQFVANSEWTLVNTAVSNSTVGTQAVVTFTLTIKRNPAFTNFYMTVPVVLLAFMTAFTFVMPVASGEKSAFAITVFLSFVVYLIIISQRMPENSDKISNFGVYVLIMTFLSALTIMVSVMELRLSTLSRDRHEIAGCTQTVTRTIQRIQGVFTCAEDGTQYKELKTTGDMGSSNKPVEWSDVTSALDFICFWVFTGVTFVVTLFFVIYLAVK